MFALKKYSRLLFAGMVFLSINTISAQDITDADSIVKSNTAFSVSLYGKIKDAKGNLFFSPYSISTALAMTYAGARGNTAKQMSQTLCFTLDQKRLHPAFSAVETKLNEIRQKGNVQLSVANAIWPQKKYPFLKEYTALLDKEYKVTITPVDYKNKTEETRVLINTWVEEKTEKKITDLIKPGLLNSLTRLTLTNAVYFKGNWHNRFDTSATKQQPFWTTPEKSAKVPTMYKKAKFGYDERDSVQILELPYIGKELSMIIFLPLKKDGLAELENKLSPQTLQDLTMYINNVEVEVFLPKFKMTCEFDLTKTLMAMGMTDAFSAKKANFSGMDGKTNWLYIGSAVHKAFVDVNEEGTEAAAATAVAMRALSIPMPPPVFRADHPFLFIIRDNTKQNILFMGRVAEPAGI